MVFLWILAIGDTLDLVCGSQFDCVGERGEERARGACEGA